MKDSLIDAEILSTLSASDAAQRLLGCELVRIIDGRKVRVRIVETEAYDMLDPASHSHNGPTPRTEIMFGPAGFVYVYFTYGMHYCLNIVVGPEGHGSAVLIRAVEPITGEVVMRQLRDRPGVQVSNGPAKLCQSLAIDKALNGHNLQDAPFKLVMKPALAASQIVTTTRIGISRATDKPWRFYIASNPYISKP